MGSGRCAALLLAALVAAAASSSFDVVQHLGTKTPYDYLVAASGRESGSGGDAACAPIVVNHVGRHGTRFPTSGTIEALYELQDYMTAHRSELVSEYAWMGEWEVPFDMSYEGGLCLRGQEELYQMGQRFVSQFPAMTSYNPNMNPIQCTCKPRTSQSGNAFGFGMLQNTAHVSKCQYYPFAITSESCDQDTTLRFFSNCPAYQTQVLDNATTLEESQLYAAKYVPQIQQRIADKIGLYPPAEQVSQMWEACQCDVSVLFEKGQWCSIFEEDDADILEYVEDLRSYWQRGYGIPLNYQIGIELLREMVNIMDAVLTDDVDSDFYLTSKLRFAHAETMLPFNALLGLNEDSEPLLASSPPDVIANRKWRDSAIAPFATNTALLLYNCTGTASVRLLVNEKDVKLPGCEAFYTAQDYCPYDNFKALFAGKLRLTLAQLCQE
eukprot:TRINITY_DN18375_c0_g1_i1.p1 TRINITY_DN18375_c0_g1~~TRINITY_DN18375_c0_g1_i1.p1  ORF type:complete len:451 (-),score=102.23 TRINITY_DN18375_c0_g1_i1:83-1399(-)